MTVGLFILSALIAWLSVAIIWRSLKAEANTSSKPPVHSTWLPFLGHIYGITTKGSNLYISSLCAAQRSSIATLKLPGQDIHLIHPLDSASIKQFISMRHLSLMSVFRIVVGPAMALTAASEKSLTNPDTGAFKRDLSRLFNGQLKSLHNLQNYASVLEQNMNDHWNNTFVTLDTPVRTGLGAWLFDVLSHSMGAVFWGEEGPFEDEDFRAHLRVFVQNLEDLRNPLTWLIPSRLLVARDYVRKAVDRAVQEQAYGRQGQDITLFGRLAVLYHNLEIPTEGFTDCHLVAIVGLMSNVINTIVWAFCHVLADPELMTCLLAEVSAVAVKSSSTNFIIDIDSVRNSCPLLVATWYELLRTYGDSPVARGVSKDSLFDGKYRLRKGSIVMTPIHLHSWDKGIWGEDVDEFRPRRFLEADGQVGKDLIKHLTVFGLPGMHQCPGRYLGHNMTLAVLAKALLSLDITAAPGDALAEGIVPKRKETMLGLPVMNRDPVVIVRRRKQVESVRVTFDKVRPGW